jgi:glutamine amidotransferase-like uncharacterized protein
MGQNGSLLYLHSIILGVETIKKFKYALFLAVIIILTISVTIYGFDLREVNKTTCNAHFKSVNVLIYDGESTSTDSVEGLIYCLEQAQNNDPNIQFNYTTTEVINSEVLSGQDVLVISGGDIELLFNDPFVNPDDIKKFVEDGNGYMGICAGAYAASNYNGDFGSGWGISPNIDCNYTDTDGLMPITITSYGINTLKYSGGRIDPCAFIPSTTDTVTLPSFPVSNTPGLYKNGKYIPIAIYAENETVLADYAAILDDTRGSGRIILSGPHPELDPSKPELVSRMVLWASKRI